MQEDSAYINGGQCKPKPSQKLITTISEMDSIMRRRAYAICRNKYDGDDAWNNAVLKLLTGYNSENLDETNLPGLLHSALMHCIIDLKRLNGVDANSVELKYAEELMVNNEYEYYNSMQVEEIMTYLNSFGDRDRGIFLMTMFGMDSKAVSDDTGESRENVRKIVSRVRSKIKKKFKYEKQYR
jgi:RNA polymerase sigma factor (sigma-70 family)